MPDNFINPLRFPGGNSPGVNYAHLAATGTILRLASVANRNNHIDLTRGRQATLSGTPVSSPHGVVGPRVTFTGTQRLQFTGRVAVTPAAFTMAAIFVADVTTAQGCCLINLNSSVTTGPFFYADVNGSGFGDNAFGSVDLQSGFPFVTGRPYFFVGSTNLTIGNFAATELSTGKIFTIANKAGAPLAITATGTTWTVGNFADGTAPYINGVAAAMYATGRLMPMQELWQWAQNPWSLWYPPIQSSYVGTAVTTPVWGWDQEGCATPFLRSWQAAGGSPQ
jgi:hypothetical protein